MSDYTDFTESWAPDQWRAECVRQARLASGASKEADALRQQLRGAVDALRELYRAADALPVTASPDAGGMARAMQQAGALLDAHGGR